MLLRQYFGGRHDGDLASIFHGDDRGLRGNNGFPRPDIPLEQAAHRMRGADVIGNILQATLLCLSRVKREDFFDRLRMPSPKWNLRSFTCRTRLWRTIAIPTWSWKSSSKMSRLCAGEIPALRRSSSFWRSAGIDPRSLGKWSC